MQTSEGESYGSIGAVVGATYPEELSQLRDLMPHVPLLVPGYGSQGGAAADVVGAFDVEGLGAVVNSSRGSSSQPARNRTEVNMDPRIGSRQSRQRRKQ
ncbi:MAG: hypothetical protein R3B91_20905 [Planctomycetaceae bacterium]